MKSITDHVYEKMWKDALVFISDDDVLTEIVQHCGQEMPIWCYWLYPSESHFIDHALESDFVYTVAVQFH